MLGTYHIRLRSSDSRAKGALGLGCTHAKAHKSPP